MAIRATPSKITAGEGFDFEDYVVAHFLILLLLQKAPLNPDYGFVSRLDFQTKTLGWFLDDLLITLKSPSGIKRWALSIKSNTQFSSKKAPQDFTRAIWQQFLSSEKINPHFEIDSDFLGMATAPHGTKVWKSIQGLLTKARSQHSADLMNRISLPGYAANEGPLLASLQCPNDLADMNEEETVRLVSCIFIEQFDFLEEPSKDYRAAIEFCRMAIRSESPDDAVALWENLVVLAKKARPKSGYYDLPKLAQQLRNSHDLKAFPRYKDDWNKIEEWTRKRLELVHMNIGPDINLERVNQRQKVLDAVNTHPAIAILGQSGVGKTVLLKQCTETWNREQLFVWIDASLLEEIELDELETRLGIRHPLHELFAAIHNQQLFLILDAVDRLVSRSSISRLSALIHAAVDTKVSSVRILISCQPEEWKRIYTELIRAECPINNWQELVIQSPTITQLTSVWDKFPSLLTLATRPHLSEIIRTPRILDLLASHLSAGKNINTDNWVGESSLVDWYWESVVKNGHFGIERSSFLQRLGQKQADHGIQNTPLIELLEGSQCLSSLITDRICVEKDEKIAFAHDSIGDWARQRVIIASTQNLDDFLATRTCRPHWHRAIRLYAVHLLEKNKDTSEWANLIDRIPKITDFLLDAVIFATNQTSLLKLIWTVLVRQEGELLKRFLRRFRHIASQPNQKLVQALSENGQGNAFSRTINRDPRSFWASWVAAFQFFEHHLEDLRMYAAVESANLAQTWLTMTPLDFPGRSTAARIAVSVAEDMHQSRLTNRYLEDEDASICYSAALAAAHELPDQLSTLIMQACSLTPVDFEVKDDGTKLTMDNSVKDRRRKRLQTQYQSPSWPDGPLFEVDEAFLDACISRSPPEVLMEINPTLTRQMLLAVLVEVKCNRSFDSDSSYFSDDDVAVKRLMQFHFPFYLQGPFLPFLQISPDEGIQTIVRLVNHATDRWCELPKYPRNRPINENGIPISQNGNRLQGEYECFYWNRGVSSCNGAVASSLMALEKWLITLFENKQSIECYIGNIFKESKSVAMIGMLADLGRQKPDLFKGILKPILLTPEFYAFDFFYNDSGFNFLGPQIDTRYGESYFNEQRDWLTAQFRKQPLIKIAAIMYGSDPEFRSCILSEIQNWSKRLNEDIPKDLIAILEHLYCVFSPDSWTKEPTDTNSEVWIFKQDFQSNESSKDEQLSDLNPFEKCEVLVQGCCDSISDPTRFHSSALEEFWEMGQQIRSELLTEDSDLEFEVLQVETAIAALLLSINAEWLNEYPDRLSWCETRLQRFTFELLAYKQSNDTTRLFTPALLLNVAGIAPRIWVNHLDDKKHREWIAIIATHFGNKITTILLKAAFEVRNAIGNSFPQLVHLVLRFSSADWEHHSEIKKYQDEDIFDMDKWWNAESKTFITNSLNPKFPHFNSTWQSQPRVWYANNRHNDRDTFHLVPPMSDSIVQAALSWIPPLNDATSQEERNSWIFLWQEALHMSTFLAQIRDIDGNILLDMHLDGGMPYRFDKWIFGKIAEVILESNDVNEVRPLWQPIIALGRQCSWWVREFLYPWFLGSLKSGDQETFFLIWREMVQMALQTNTWIEYREQSRMHGNDLWCDLIGVDKSYHLYWQSEHKHVFKQLTEWYEPVAIRVLILPDTAINLIRWLTLPAAESVLIPSLNWILKVAKDHPNWLNHEEHLGNEIACLLDHCWKSKEIEFGFNSDDSFHELVRLLSERQNPLAMDLEDRIAKGEI
ncbi:NACHT domain protein [Gimesia alba]|uniref:NACHT domain protein n=1 Tax=Gimesia alba TaxID=2527973 RepID=A0A517RD18_9PLAN|nr:hypothetical protein [Gimesia alba]QDT41781.1 NACHT domain protein [Gimesia alba]